MKKLGFGCMRLPLKDGDDQKSVDMDAVCSMVDTFLEKGFTYVDTAYMYHGGLSEGVVGEALVKRHPRESFVLASKLPTMMINSEEDQIRIFDEQLERCGVEYFDNYLLHNLNVVNYETAKRLNSFDFVQQKKKEGKVKRIGFSFHDHAELLDEILTEHPEMEFVQLQINYLDWKSQSIQSQKCYEVARSHNVPVIVMEPVKGGILAKLPEKAEELFRSLDETMSPASWAIRYAASLEGVEMVLSGMSDMEQMQDNMSYMQELKVLTAAEQTAVAEAVTILKDAYAIPCTACQYCVDDCPQNIAIPEYFALYNTEKQLPPAEFSLQKLYYGNYNKRHGKASECIECGSCEGHCPQHIPIMKWLKEVSATFE